MSISELAKAVDSNLLQPVAVKPITEKVVVEAILSLYPQIFDVSGDGHTINAQLRIL